MAVKAIALASHTKTLAVMKWCTQPQRHALQVSVMMYNLCVMACRPCLIHYKSSATLYRTIAIA